MISPCPNGTLYLGYTSENFPTFFQDEVTGRFDGVNVMFWKEFASRFSCSNIEYLKLSNEDYACSTRNCMDAVTREIDRARVFADADGSVLDTDIVYKHKYSSMSDSSKARSPLRDGPLNISFYVVYTPEAAALLFLLFLCRSILSMIRKRTRKEEIASSGVSNIIRTLFNLVDFVNRLAQLFIVLLLYSFYQSLFNGNAAMELLEPSTPFALLLSLLWNGTERLVVNDGMLMTNEMASFGPGTTSLEDTIDRIHQICSDSHATGLFYEDELTQIAYLTVQERQNCRLSRIAVDDVSKLSLPRLQNQFGRGVNFFFLMPRQTSRQVIEVINAMLSRVFRFDLRSFYVKKFISARGIETATQAVSAASVDEQQFYYRPLSIHNLFYPLIFFAGGIFAALLSIILERIVHVCSKKETLSNIELH